MKFGKKTLALIISIFVIVTLSVIAIAVDSDYDSTSDPLVAKSYLDSSLESQRLEYEAIINELEKSIDDRLENIVDSSDGNLYVTANTSFEAVTLEKGDIIYPKDGIIEVIVCSGGAVAYDPNGTGKIINSTKGVVLANGKTLVQNHLIIIPESEGRGVKVVSSTGAEILIRGEYTVEHTN